MHTQHVKFSTYVAWGSVVGVAVAVGVVFEEGEVGLDDDVAGSVLEVVVVVVFFLPSPSLVLVFFLVVLLDFIDTTYYCITVKDVKSGWSNIGWLSFEFEESKGGLKIQSSKTSNKHVFGSIVWCIDVIENCETKKRDPRAQ
jgi:hypothetical protein